MLRAWPGLQPAGPVMRSAFSAIRHRAPWLVALPGLMLLAGLVVGGGHHHDAASDHACAVCTLSHAPAPGPVAAPLPAAPVTFGERIVLPSDRARIVRTPVGHS